MRFKLSILIVLIIILCGCGRKALPVPPRHEPPPTVNDLSSSIEGDMLRLSWTVPEANKKIMSNLSGFVVYRSKKMVSGSECKKCPLLFKRIADVPVDVINQKDSKKKNMTYNETLGKGYRYIYKVAVYTNTGASGKDSNYIEFDH
ncbi:MAG: hypothetical protein SRB1_01018 [Desulfobacteraceae bacterium Eth-SRB1]|nr:MAG: hypothetical protein SRB1_01018 [Desulfobacteraceae bacterium Eth-SRB1]